MQVIQPSGSTHNLHCKMLLQIIIHHEVADKQNMECIEFIVPRNVIIWQKLNLLILCSRQTPEGVCIQPTSVSPLWMALHCLQAGQDQFTPGCQSWRLFSWLLKAENVYIFKERTKQKKNLVELGRKSEVNIICVLLTGAREEPRALVLASACSLASAASTLAFSWAWVCLNFARLRAAISSASSICFL